MMVLSVVYWSFILRLCHIILIPNEFIVLRELTFTIFDLFSLTCLRIITESWCGFPLTSCEIPKTSG